MKRLKFKTKAECLAALDTLSGSLLGLPYEANPLGEGPLSLHCQKPLFRFDAFDCLTFINTVLASLNAGTDQSCPNTEFLFHMRRLNYYGGNARYENRYHFMSADWNPENIRNGYIHDLTETIVDHNGNRLCEYATTYINKSEWLRKQGFHDLAEKAPKAVHVCTPYIPLTELFTAREQPCPAIWAQLPQAGIVEIVRPNWDLRQTIGTHLDISHLGFIIQQNHTLLFRHASSQSPMQVTEEPLENYLKRYLSSTTVKGIAVFTLSDGL